LKKVKKNWSHELKHASIDLRKRKARSRQVKKRILNHCHGRLGTYPLGYEINARLVTK